MVCPHAEMTTAFRPRPLDRYTQIGDLAETVRWVVQRSLLPISVILLGEIVFLFFSGSRGTGAFAMIAVGTVIVLGVWRTRGIGLPLVPLIAIQNLIVYALPIVIGHEVLASYPENYITKAGLELLIFSCSLVGAWLVGMEVFRPASALSYALQGFDREGSSRLKRLGLTLITGSSLYLLCQSLNLLGFIFTTLPDGSYSLITTLVSATGACGFFLVSMFVGTRGLSLGGRAFFWALLAGNCFISAAGFLLSATTALLASVLIGLFWSTGRMPWRYLAIVVLILSYLNLGKITMRERYWNPEGDSAPLFTLVQMPRYYTEWIQASYEAMVPDHRHESVLDEQSNPKKTQSLLERVNNLQNLLFVIDAMDRAHIPPLYGETYALIPPLLAPRIFWPEKPRTHEGQIRLNVHFGRQDLESTFQTYVAWGLLPEAYGNFGEKAGAIFLGVCLGLFFAWIENFTAQKLLLSLEGFLAFSILLGLVGSFEMVASVLITSVFQSMIVLVIATAFFVEPMILQRPEAGPS